MSLADRCSHVFDVEVRNQGQQCFLDDWVTILDHRSGELLALVEGRKDHEVVLDWTSSREQLAICCTCSHFAKQFTCLHVWATILAADAQGIGPRGNRQLGILPVSPEDYGSDLIGAFGLHDLDDLDDNPPPLPPKRGRGKSGPNRKKSPPVPAWQRQLSWSASPDADADEEEARAHHALPATREVWYVFDGNYCDGMTKPVLFFYQRQRRSTGEFGKLKELALRPHEVKDGVGPDDVELLTLLVSYQSADDDSFGSAYRGYANRVSDAIVPQAVQSFLLPRLAATGRLAFAGQASERLTIDDLQPLAWDGDQPWRFRLDIQPDDQRELWTLSGQLFREDGSTRTVQELRAYFRQGIFIFGDRVGLAEVTGSWRMLEALFKTPKVEVPYADRWDLLRRLWQLPTAPEMNFPANLRVDEVSLVPQGRLVIDAPERYDPYRLPGRIDFLYDGKPVSTRDAARGIVDEERGRVLVRDRQRERELVASLAARGVRPMEGWRSSEYSVWVSRENMPAAVEALIHEGWIVEAQGYHVRRAGAWQMSVTSGIDWFDLAGKLDFDGLEVQLPAVLDALRHGHNYVRLNDGSRGLLPKEWLDRFASIARLGEAEGEAIRFRSSQALLLDALLAAQEQVTFDAPFARLREKLRSFNGVAAAAAPPGFEGELRPYQKIGLGWLQFLQEFRLGGCLADDMGLGKTVQVLAMLEARRLRPADEHTGRRAPSLAVVPKSLVFNWIEEAKRFTPELRVLDYTGIQRGSLARNFDDYDLIVTTYGTMQRDIVQLKDLRFDYAILDESQAIKNAQSQRAKASRLLKADHRLAMTGTPVENHLGELWSLLEFLNPGMLGSASVFQDISKKITQDGEELALLRRALGPFVLRRTKQQVLTELPPKTEQTLHCDLEDKQRKRYDELRTYYRASLTQQIAKSGMAKAKIHVLEALLRLRQAAIHPGLIDKAAAADPSAKLDVLMDQLREIIDEGHKALVFSQFTSFLAIVRDRLDREGLVYEYLDGRTRQRQQHVERFQNDPLCPLFLISLKAGGHGLNLTAADYVFILDPWWNPAVEAQAIDRAHRIGQDRHVFAYRLIARDTVEEKILELQKTKRDLAEAIISADGNVLSRLTAEDLELLLS